MTFVKTEGEKKKRKGHAHGLLVPSVDDSTSRSAESHGMFGAEHMLDRLSVARQAIIGYFGGAAPSTFLFSLMSRMGSELQMELQHSTTSS